MLSITVGIGIEWMQDYVLQKIKNFQDQVFSLKIMDWFGLISGVVGGMVVCTILLAQN